MAIVGVVLPMGSFNLSADRVWRAVFNPAAASSDELLIVWEFRIPRILLGILIGAMLAVAGALMQSVTRNGLADPGLIGVTEGATVVILFTVIIDTGIPPQWYPALGMVGGALVAAFVLFLTRRAVGVKFVLIGIGVSAFLSAGISIFLTYGNISQVQSAMIWMAGSLAPASWDIILRALPWAIAGLAAAVLTTRATDASLLGHTASTALGIRGFRLRIILIATSVALTAASVAAVGTLGFVGLVAPHLARFLVGANQSALIAGSAACGAVLVLLADSLGRLVFAPIQIPAGIVMALIGVPFFLWLLWRRRHTL
ncbi:MAG: iron ABC transporter permease [Bauldia sp.]|nr:iron ABC transporter permease [Bauldia sp.]